MVKPIICGIYKITSPTGKIYIGQSCNIFFRWDEYKRLRCSGHEGEKNHFFGKTHSGKTKIESSEKLKIIKNLPEQRRKNSESHMGLQTGFKNGKSKLVLNTLTGIYYECIRSAAESIGFKPSNLSKMMVGSIKNKTPFIYA